MQNEDVIADLKQFISTTISQQFANVATKDDLEKFATKADWGQLATKNDLAKMESKLNRRLDDLDGKVTTIADAHAEQLGTTNNACRSLKSVQRSL